MVTHLMQELDSTLAPLLEKFYKAGTKAYPVGGCVRDLMLGRPLTDIDLTTPASPEIVKKIFNRVIDTGILHGTVTVLFQGNAFEVTTFRKDIGYTDHRHPDGVEFKKDLSEDLMRRDFSINAMAWDPEKKVLIDPFGGQEDCKNRILRAVGDPERRFSEDSLRIFRLFRFASQLGFSIDPSTELAATKLSDHCRKLSFERIHVEMEKLLMGSHWVTAWGLAESSGALRTFLPFVEPRWKRDSFEKALVLTESQKHLRWAYFFLNYGILTPSTVEPYLKTLKFSRVDSSEISRTLDVFHLLLEGIRDPSILLLAWKGRKNLNWLSWLWTFPWVGKIPREELQTLVTERAEDPRPLFLNELAVTGTMLLELGFLPGPELGKVLQGLLIWSSEHSGRNTPELLLEEAMSLLRLRPQEFT